MNDPLGLFDEGGNDPLGLFAETTLGEDFKIGLANAGTTADRFVSGLALGAADLFGDKEGAEDIYANLHKRKDAMQQWANPEGKQQTFGGKAASMLTTLPAQVAAMPFAPAETGQVMLEKGESLPRAAAGTIIDTLGNMASVLAPASIGKGLLAKGATGAAMGAGQDVATRLGIQAVSEQDATKEHFAPTTDTTLLAGMLGGGVGVAVRNTKRKLSATEQAKLDSLQRAQAEADAVKATAPTEPHQLELPLENSVQQAAEVNAPKQLDLFDTREDVGVPPEVLPQPELPTQKLGDIENPPVTVDGLNQGMAGKQRGAVLFGDPQKKKALDALHLKLKNEVQMARDPDIDAELPKAYGEKDGGNLSRNLESGSTLAAMNRSSTAIKLASRFWQNGDKRADLLIRENIQKKPETSLRKLSTDRLQTLAEVMKLEATNGKKFDGAILEKTLDADQLVAYQHLRDMHAAALKVQNDARAAKGKPPITEMEAYMSSRWQGDYRMPVFDTAGNLVWYLAADSRLGVKQQLKALQKQFPGLKPGDVKTFKSVRTKGHNMTSVFSDIIDVLGRDDPAIAKIQEAIQKQEAFEGELFRGQTKHHKGKAGIRGYIGDRPGADPAKEAMAYLESQMDYARNAFRWSEYQKAVDGVKKITSDETLAKNQKNNVKYIQDLSKNYLGINEDLAVRRIEDGIREHLGVSPSLIGKGVGDLKTMFILQKLAVSAGHLAANGIQYANVLPHLMDMRAQGVKGNPLKATLVAIPNGMIMAMGHYLSKMGVDYLADIKHAPGGDFLMRAFKYAEDNGVTARSIYDESPVTSRGAVAKVGEGLSKTMILPEVLVRGTAFMAYAQMLKDSGKYGNDFGKLFQEAEERVNASMVDYRQAERPMMFSKLGVAGNALNTLQTYPINFYNQWRYFGKQAMKGNYGPILTALLVQYAVAGMSGIPGFNDMDRLWTWIKSQLPDSAWMKVKDIDPKLWLMENMGDASVYGLLSEGLGIGLTSRVTAPSPSEMVGSPLAPAADALKQAGNLGSLAMDPTNSTKAAQALYDSTPVGLQGLLETTLLEDMLKAERKDGSVVWKKTSDMADRDGKFVRTQDDVDIRRWGLRSQNEVKASDKQYKEARARKEVTDRITTIPDKLYDAVRRGDMKDVQEYTRIYQELTGADRDFIQQMIDARIEKEFMSADEKSRKRTEADPLEIMKMKKRIRKAFE
jgi:hypothetical protein